ncbi:potassium-transporting ATPase subunit KdpC [Asaia krungthepensis]|uniref:Potassium-transporting ATPase KdpC subunit n=1 Tax=Asaia krungthepensis NRIC 0535 TaxID=1307925 RepID=A0ABQ0Q253_9PROT|nr:potassium-transporting ATPase subunit KdpC [Asaia krungthepensis]GBQ87664.1 potassium transporter ATPase C chain KdpC [Asaia krungthepensis NRIC 0535]
MVLSQLRPALVLFLLLSLLTGIVYPLGMTALSGLILPDRAAGSLVYDRGRVIGSSLIGQDFASPRYFHGRPSATMGPDPRDSSKTVATPYNAAASLASNAGPTSKALLDRVTATTNVLKLENPEAMARGWRIPVELVMTSASGLDPDLSPEGALFQVLRVARARGLDEERIRHLVLTSIRQPLLGFLGEPHVNVLALNRALDRLAQ